MPLAEAEAILQRTQRQATLLDEHDAQADLEELEQLGRLRYTTTMIAELQEIKKYYSIVRELNRVFFAALEP